jgi:transcription antitermination factor NusG
VRVRTQSEKRVQSALNAAGIDEFLPTFRETVRWSDRTKVVDRPLFPGYIFVRLVEVLPVLQISGVVQLLGSNLKPLPIPEDQIDAVRRVCLSTVEASPCPYEVGADITIASGPLAGVKGIIRRIKGATRLVVAIEILRRAISVEIDADTVTK